MTLTVIALQTVLSFTSPMLVFTPTGDVDGHSPPDSSVIYQPDVGFHTTDDVDGHSPPDSSVIYQPDISIHSTGEVDGLWRRVKYRINLIKTNRCRTPTGNYTEN